MGMFFIVDMLIHYEPGVIREFNAALTLFPPLFSFIFFYLT